MSLFIADYVDAMTNKSYAVEDPNQAELRCVLARFGSAVDVLGLSDREVDQLIDHPGGSWRAIDVAHPPHQVAEGRMRLLTEIAHLALGMLGCPQQVACWIRAPNPALRGEAVPLDELLVRPWEMRALRDALAREQVDGGR